MFLVNCEQATELCIEDVTTSGTVDSKSEESVSISMGPEQGTVSLKIDANKAWAVSFVNDRADDWIKVYPEQGEGAGVVSLTVEANDTYEERSAALKIESEDLSKTVRITQKQNNAVLVSSNRVELGPDSEDFTLEVRHNVEYFVKIDVACASWISASNTKSLVTDNVSFVVAKNPDLNRREGKIRFVASDGEEVVTVYQAGETPSIVLSKTEYTVSDNGAVFNIDVTSNIRVDYSISESWIKPVTTRTMSTDRYTFEVSPNDGVEARSAEITFFNEENGVTQKVMVYQMQKDALVVARPSYQIDNNGGNITIEVGHNVDYSYEINGDWITRLNTKSYTTENLVFAIAANTGYDSREGSIVFTSSDKKLTQTVKIYQSQTDALIVSAKEFNVSDEGETISFEIKSNIDFEVQNPDVDWVREINTRALASYTKTYVVDKNETYDSRTAQIVVINKKTQETDKVTINQCQKDALIISTREFSFDAAGGDFEVALKSNIDYEYSSDADWINAVTTKALVEHRHAFKVAAITDDTIERTGHVTFTNKTTGITDQVTVTQVNAILIDKTKMNLVIGETGQIVATVNTENKTVIWESSDKGVATVDNSGTVSSVSKGKATITVYTSDRKYSRSCEIVVDDIEAFVTARFVGGAYRMVNDIVLSGSSLYYRITNDTESSIVVNSIQLIDGQSGIEGNLMDAGSHEVVGKGNWTVSITLNKNISSPITVYRYTYNGVEHMAICNMDGIVTEVPIMSISLSKTTMELEVEESQQLTATVRPSIVTAPAVTWTSSDESVAVVDSEGNVTGKSAGEATIKATAGGKEATCKVTVSAKSTIINFADPEVKSICVKNWDTNGDGELSEKEAAAVTSIGNSFTGNTSLKTFDEFIYFTGVQKVPMSAFKGCSSLASIVLPQGVTMIDLWAFESCSSLITIDLPYGLTRIRDSVFEGCSSLTSIDLPETLTILENRAFSGCSSLISIKLPDSISSIGAYLFYNCSSLRSVTMPEELINIGESAFSGCSSLSSISLPDGVTSIESSTFSSCSSLTSISLPNKLTTIGYHAFAVCSSLTYIELPESVTTIKGGAFQNCSLLCEIKMPEAVTCIEDDVFDKCTSLKSIRWPEGVQSIGDYSFYSCTSLESIILPEGITSIGKSAFYDCSSLESIILPEGITSIGKNAFCHCYSLSSISIGEGLNTIDAYAFSGCKSLVSISLPASVTSIGFDAFMYCKNLESFTIYATVPPILAEEPFVLTPCTIYVPSSSLDLYKAADVWSELATRIKPIE